MFFVSSDDDVYGVGDGMTRYHAGRSQVSAYLVHFHQEYPMLNWVVMGTPGFTSPRLALEI